MKYLFLLVLLTLVSGCSVFMPYDSNFSCPSKFNGKCVSIQGAYSDSLAGNDKETQSARQESGNVAPAITKEESAHLTYKESLYKRFDGLLKEPKMPIVLPPQVMRVLLLPYKGEGNELYMLRYVYFFVDEAKWALGDSLEAMED